MASIATENLKLGEEQRAQQQREIDARLSGEQESMRQREAQNVLKLLQTAYTSGEVPGTEALTDACLKAEEMMLKLAQAPTLEPSTRLLLEDIAQLAGTIKQTARHNDLSDRLNKIAEETKKALALAAQVGLSAGVSGASSIASAAPAAAEASKQALALLQTWRPLFNIVTGDKQFRILIVDTLKLVRRIYGRHTSGIGSEIKQKFLEGEKTTDIAKEVSSEIKDSVTDDEGNLQVDVKDEEWEQLQDELFSILRRLSSQPKYHEALEWMFSLIDLFHSDYTSTKLITTDKTAAAVQLHTRRATTEAQELVASFTGHEVFYGWVDSLKQLTHSIDASDESKKYLSEVKQFVLMTKDAAHLSKEEYKKKGRELINHGRQLIRQLKYSTEIENFLNSSDTLVDKIRHDETLTVLRHHAGIVVSDLSFVDKDGNIQVDVNALAKLRDIVMPILAEGIKYIPLPKIEDADDKRHYWVDNIVLCGYDIIPENIRFEIESDSNVSLRDANTKHADTRLILTLSKIRTELKNLEFFYHKKTFPEITEKGRANVKIGGEGANLRIVFEIEQNATDKAPKLKEGRVDFHISKLDIEFEKKTLTHDVLVPMMASMWNLQIQSQIESAVEKNATNFIQSIADKITEQLVAINKPFHKGVSTFQNVVGEKAFATVYENRQQKLE